MKYLMQFSYDGSKFNGYQKQPHKNTVQDKLEEALTKINSNKHISVSASGRTDSGVHAYMQCAHFELDNAIDLKTLKNSINKLIKPYVYIDKLMEVNNDFHARFDVVQKTYQYKINVGEYNPLEVDYVYQYNKELDISVMREALNYLIGTHNFKAFTKSDCELDSYERTIYKADIILNNNYLIMTFTGNGFMRYMIRNIVGTLIEVGIHKREPNSIIDILNSKNRINAGKTANPEGLYLLNVRYGGNIDDE